MSLFRCGELSGGGVKETFVGISGSLNNLIKADGTVVYDDANMTAINGASEYISGSWNGSAWVYTAKKAGSYYYKVLDSTETENTQTLSVGGTIFSHSGGWNSGARITILAL